VKGRRLLISFFALCALYGLIDAIFLGEPVFGLAVATVTGSAVVVGLRREARDAREESGA
jgi:hypothetical protein